jgi:Polyketide cyclase / dehydrase and lipid transport
MHSLVYFTHVMLNIRQLRRAVIRSLGLGVLLACAAAGALATGRTVSVTEKVDLAATPAQTWAAIKDFNGWQAWHPAFARTEITKGQGNRKGTVRVLTAKDGAQFTEELLAHDATSRTVQYRITESPLPITGYVSTLEVKGNKGGSSVVWSSHFEVRDGASEDEVKKAIAGVYRTGLDHLESVLK